MKRKNVINENYLDRKPLRAPHIVWNADDEGKVTLEIENKGIAKRITQILLRKPKISYIHLDDMGSFIWPKLDGDQTITELGADVKEKFGEEAEPLYERLAQYVWTLENYGFIIWGN